MKRAAAENRRARGNSLRFQHGRGFARVIPCKRRFVLAQNRAVRDAVLNQHITQKRPLRRIIIRIRSTVFRHHADKLVHRRAVPPRRQHIRRIARAVQFRRVNRVCRMARTGNQDNIDLLRRVRHEHEVRHRPDERERARLLIFHTAPTRRLPPRAPCPSSA